MMKRVGCQNPFFWDHSPNLWEPSSRWRFPTYPLLHPSKMNECPLKRDHFQRKIHLPTINIFRGHSLVFREVFLRVATVHRAVVHPQGKSPQLDIPDLVTRPDCSRRVRIPSWKSKGLTWRIIPVPLTGVIPLPKGLNANYTINGGH